MSVEVGLGVQSWTIFLTSGKWSRPTGLEPVAFRFGALLARLNGALGFEPRSSGFEATPPCTPSRCAIPRPVAYAG